MYFAAHGLYKTVKDNNGNIVPIIPKVSSLEWGIGFHGTMPYNQLSKYQDRHGGIAIHYIIDSCYAGSFDSLVDTAKGSMGVFATKPNDPGKMNNDNIIGGETGSVFTINLRDYIQNHSWSSMTMQNIINNVKSDGTAPTARPNSGVFFSK